MSVSMFTPLSRAIFQKLSPFRISTTSLDLVETDLAADELDVVILREKKAVDTGWGRRFVRGH